MNKWKRICVSFCDRVSQIRGWPFFSAFDINDWLMVNANFSNISAISWSSFDINTTCINLPFILCDRPHFFFIRGYEKIIPTVYLYCHWKESLNLWWSTMLPISTKQIFLDKVTIPTQVIKYNQCCSRQISQSYWQYLHQIKIYVIEWL